MSYHTAEDDMYTQSPGGGEATSAQEQTPVQRQAGGNQPGAGLYEVGKKATALAGRVIKVDKRLFKYDVRAGDAKPLPFVVTKDDRMSAVEGGERLDYIHKKLGVDREGHDVLSALDKSLFFCHTINGASVLNPGRSVFGVPNKTENFEYGAVREILGVDFRRFFRAYADEIRLVNKGVLRNYDPYDIESSEAHGWLMQAASDRGLSRFPDLAHDSADACTTLTMTERAALATSKAYVLSKTLNAADQVVGERAVDAGRRDRSDY